MRVVTFLLCVLLSSVSCTSRSPTRPLPNSSTFAWPTTPAADRLKALLTAYNTGEETRLQEFVRANYQANLPVRAVERTAAYWLSVFRQFGPATPHAVYSTTAEATEIWLRGDISEAWFTLSLEVGAQTPHFVTAGGVGRGIVPPNHPTSAPLSADALAKYLADYLARLDQKDLFSGTVLVAQGDRIVFEGATGFADRSSGVCNNADTRFYIASVGKMFTSVAMLQLADAGKLSLSDPVTKHVPQYPKPLGDRITLRHLLLHTSGIELDDDSLYNRDAQRARDASALLAAQLRHLPKLEGFPDRQPLTKFDYSNEGYDLAGIVIERATGRSFHDVVRTELFEKAGMTASGEYAADFTIPHVAIGYTSRDGLTGRYLPGPLRSNVYWLDAYGRPSGGHYSTARDLWHFTRALQTFKLISEAATNTAMSSQLEQFRDENEVISYGLGFEIRERNGVRRIGHAGGLPGASARFDLYPASNYIVIVLSNHDWVANNVADRIAELIGAR